ncbi:bifunctional glycosyltransferase family 2 protein/CDP-glycerol:glycerophosphate glycerophosphotransferase [Bacillus sp. PS06]|uniref:bifunctional glycosyltransferase/CDP-glycerol:glycerophosphate glycerophosphotransferase n=1 Tax=Bacillus sp. PS06 TaxID=2764176 RepID=UPI0017807D4F|nr:bifunctional glycosyltransferase family 2 protein/CDP-glycerol:glycerophosphate glycerophosphotransferase [Bacillus sp. PS06]MBD8070560.1 bifunctional glycosyltransferase family 2 protein/CDP-glycerol:glycerophosphate glycerophosphotransferase [Bacillus sp. PS06]
MKKISVIIPVYNTTEFINDCLESVFLQTYRHLEIIIVNDGSNEALKQQLTELSSKDQRVQCYHLDSKNGVGFARNYGMKKATGDYLLFLDSDDYLALDAIELLVNSIGEAPIIAGRTKKFSVPIDNKTLPLKEDVVIKERGSIKTFKDMSIVNKLISVDFITTNYIRFNEDTNCYTDVSFIVSIIDKLERISMLKARTYFKRRRNDPIINPSLDQASREEKVIEFLTVFQTVKNKQYESECVQTYLDYIYLNFFRREIIMLLEDEKKVTEYAVQLSNTAKQLSQNAFNNLNPVVKRELSLLRNEKINTFANTIKFHHFLRKIKYALGGRTKLFLQLYRSFFMRLPIKEKTIVFESFLGKNYSDSPKYIYEYMLQHNKDYTFVWIFNDPTKKIPGPAKKVKRFSLTYYYYLATSKYWVSNSRLPRSLNKRKDNIYLQTWHGTPLKKLVFDMNDVHSANPNYKKHFYDQSRRWDYLISPNQYSSDIFRRAFLFDKEMLEFGYPRNDILYADNKQEIAQSIKQKLQLPKDKKIVLYAPTWRDDEFYEPGKYKFKLELDLQKMREELGSEYIILLRMHYFIADHIETTGLDGFVYNLSKYDDIAELYLISDILITDYSSVFFDYANLKRPILFFTYDLEKYRDTLRGFYIDVEKEVPGPLLKTSDEVISSIKHINQIEADYKEKYGQFYEKFCAWDNGKASEQVVNRVFK